MAAYPLRKQVYRERGQFGVKGIKGEINFGEIFILFFGGGELTRFTLSLYKHKLEFRKHMSCGMSFWRDTNIRKSLPKF